MTTYNPDSHADLLQHAGLEDDFNDLFVARYPKMALLKFQCRFQKLYANQTHFLTTLEPFSWHMLDNLPNNHAALISIIMLQLTGLKVTSLHWRMLLLVSMLQMLSLSKHVISSLLDMMTISLTISLLNISPHIHLGDNYSSSLKARFE